MFRVQNLFSVSAHFFRVPHVCRAVQTGMAGRILLVPKECPDRVLDKSNTYGILPSIMVDSTRTIGDIWFVNRWISGKSKPETPGKPVFFS